MQGQWNWWHHIGVISDEKYKRLIRSTPFTDDEKYILSIDLGIEDRKSVV